MKSKDKSSEQILAMWTPQIAIHIWISFLLNWLRSKCKRPKSNLKSDFRGFRFKKAKNLGFKTHFYIPAFYTVCPQ